MARGLRIFLMVTSRPFLAKMPASFASVSGAKPVQPEMPIETLVWAEAGAASPAARRRAARRSLFMTVSLMLIRILAQSEAFRFFIV